MAARAFSASLRRRRALYIALLAVQTLCVTVLVFEFMPFFWRLVDELGEVQDVSAWNEVIAICCVVVFQACYWWRLKNLGMPFTTSSQLASHAVLFVGRLSFLFAGTVASLVFFRHMPMLAPANLTLAGAVRLVLFFAVLFSWFCYSMELERLGKRQSRA